MGKNAVFLSFVFTYFFSSMIHGDSICWNEKYEENEKGEELVGMWWKKRKDKLYTNRKRSYIKYQVTNKNLHKKINYFFSLHCDMLVLQ
jgi:hypothetical protein